MIAAYNGLIEMYDSIVLNKSIWDNKKVHRPKLVQANKPIKYIHGAINCFAYSSKYDIIAYAGVAGKIHVMD